MVVEFFLSADNFQYVYDTLVIYGYVVYCQPVFDCYMLKVYGVTPDMFQKLYDWVNHIQEKGQV